MKIVTSNAHLLHDPPYEIFTDQERLTYTESPCRVDSILETLQKNTWLEIATPHEFGIEPLLTIHSLPYLTYLQNAYVCWETSSPAKGMAFIPYTYSIKEDTSLHGEISETDGFFLTDLTVPFTAGTYQAAYTSAQIALTSAQYLISGDAMAYGLCRPPGHHAGRDICGGYCFLNNSAIAAQWLSRQGKIVILDIDFHAGNGTQSIFYQRSDIFTISLHADPQRSYPYFSGYAHETGEGIGTGFHRNFPLPQGIDDRCYLEKLEEALELISNFNPVFIVVSAGMDIYKDDPLGDFSITQDGIYKIGRAIASLRLPTLFIQEGGYYLERLGTNVLALLSGFKENSPLL